LNSAGAAARAATSAAPLIPPPSFATRSACRSHTVIGFSPSPESCVTLNSFPAPTSSPPSTNTSRPKASRPSATTAPTATKYEAYVTTHNSSLRSPVSALKDPQVFLLRSLSYGGQAGLCPQNTQVSGFKPQPSKHPGFRFQVSALKTPRFQVSSLSPQKDPDPWAHDSEPIFWTD